MAKGPEIQHYFSAEDDPCLGLEEMRAYQDGKLGAVERHRLERHLLNCELCSMAYEDFEAEKAPALAAGAEAIADAAWKRVAEKKKRRGAVIWMSAAAGVMLLVTVGWLALRGPSEEKMQDVFSEMLEKTQAPDTFDQDPQQAIAQNTEPAVMPPLMDSWTETEHKPASPTSKGPDRLQPTMEAPKAMAAEKQNGGDAFYKNVENSQADEVVTAEDAASYDFDDALGNNRREPDAKDMRQENTGLDKEAVVIGMPRPNTTTATGSAKAPQNVPSDAMRHEAKKTANQGKTAGKAKSASPDAGVMRSRSMSDPQPAKRDQAAGEESMPMEDEMSDNELAESRAGFPATDSMAVVSTAPIASKFELGMDAYGRKDFAQAATLLRAATSETPSNLQAHLYAANAFLSINQPQAAIYHLDRILAQPGSTYHEEATWYKALAYLKLNEANKAKNLLKDIVKDNGKYATPAQTALDQLD